MNWLGQLLALLAATVWPLTVEVLARPRYPCEGRQRSRAQVRSFIRQHPCPAGPDQGRVTRCRGWEVDHIIPLACCGRDDPSNMQWLTSRENRLKGAAQCRMD